MTAANMDPSRSGTPGGPLILHQFPTSPFCAKVRAMLAVKGVPFERRDYRMANARAVRKINPAGKLPVLEHSGTFVSDSTEIAYYLDRQFPNHPLVPEDARGRALTHIIEDWADESLVFYEMALRFVRSRAAHANVDALLSFEKPGIGRRIMGLIVPVAIRRSAATQGIGRKNLGQLLNDVDRHVAAIDALLVGRDWLVGETIGLADITVAIMFGCVRDAPETHDSFELHPDVTRWMARVDEAIGVDRR